MYTSAWNVGIIREAMEELAKGSASDVYFERKLKHYIPEILQVMGEQQAQINSLQKEFHDLKESLRE